MASLEYGDWILIFLQAVELPYKFDNNKRKTEANSRHVSPTSTDSSSLKGTPPVSETELKTYRLKQFSPKEQNYLYQPAVPCVRSKTLCYPPPSPPPPLSSLNLLDSPNVYKKPLSDHNTSDLHLKSEKPQSLTCRHCRRTYTPEENVKGSCEHAPDCVRTSIDTVTCIPCARSMVYHCMSDSEGNFAQQPCECDTSDNGCAKRWLGLAVLSILLPCLWCYPPLKVCHLCGVSCGACGGRHEPVNAPSTATS